MIDEKTLKRLHFWAGVVGQTEVQAALDEVKTLQRDYRRLKTALKPFAEAFQTQTCDVLPDGVYRRAIEALQELETSDELIQLVPAPDDPSNDRTCQ